MKATLTADFAYSFDGLSVTYFKAGDEVEGEVAKSAAAQGKAKPVDRAEKSPKANKADAPTSTKDAK